MFFEKFKSKEWKYDDIQFATSIVLDRYGEIEAAKAMLVFLKGTQGCAYEKETNRRALAEYLTKQSKETGKDLIAITIDYFFDNKVFKKGRANRVINSTVNCTLEEKLKNGITRECLVNEISRIFAHNDATMLLYLYVSTEMFREQLVNFCREESKRVSGRTDAAGDDVVEQLLEMIREEVHKYHSYYSTETCSPDSVLFPDRTKTSGAISFIQKKQRETYLGLFNSVGIESHMSGTDNMTLMDSVSISGNVLPVDIDFINVCSKIQAASALLFSHRNDAKPYYDIFSYHRNKVINTKGKALASSNLQGCTLQFGIDSQLLCDSNPTLKEKFSVRSELWEIFDELLDKNITIDQLSDIYDRNIRHTKRVFATSNGKNGKLLYSISEHTSRAAGSTNGKRFFMLFNGYLALKELLAFLNSSSNSLGVSMYDFPVEIFRDKRLLSRVKNFEDYIKYGSEICKLIAEEEQKPDHLTYQIDGLLNNDTVYSQLTERNVVQSDQNVQAFMNTPINEISNSFLRFNESTDDIKKNVPHVIIKWNTEVFPKLNMIANKVGLRSYRDLFNPEALRNLSDIRINDLVKVFANTILGLRESVFEEHKEVEALRELKGDPYLWQLVILFGFILMMASSRPGDVPICTPDGQYAHVGHGFNKVLAVSDHYPISDEAVLNLLKKEMEVIRFSMWLFWGNRDEYDAYVTGKKPEGSKWKPLWAYWCIVMKLASFSAENITIVDFFVDGEKDTDLLIIESTAKMEVLNIQYPIKSVSELSVLKDLVPSSRCYLLLEDGMDNYVEYQKYRDKMTVTAFNQFLYGIRVQLTVHKALTQSIDVLAGSIGKHDLERDRNTTVLKEASATLLSEMMIGNYDQKMNQSLKISGLKFNSDGFVIRKNSEVFYLRGSNSEEQSSSRTRRYIHIGGFFVIWYPSDENHFEVKKLTGKDLEEIVREASRGG